MELINYTPPLLESRPTDSHKGLFGHVLVIGGDQGFGGAGIMAAQAALISGAGLVGIATQNEHVPAVLARQPELMTVGLDSSDQLEEALKRPNVLVLGPGLGQSAWSQSVFDCSIRASQTMVVDADALNLLSQQTRHSVRDDWILTPHSTEASRLLGVTTKSVQADRLAAATAIQTKFGGTIVLKGAGTIVVGPRGAFQCKLGNPAMSTAGMGDVLSGVIGGLLAQNLPSIDAACMAVWAHARAGDLAANELGRHIRATDIFPFIRRLW